MASFKPIRIYKSELNSFPIVDGQVIIVKDTFEQFLDISSDKRIKITDIIKLTEQERSDILTPIEHIYFTTDKKKLWEYASGTWTLLNSYTLSAAEISNALGYTPANSTQIDELYAEIYELKYGIDLDGGNAYTNALDYESDFDGGGAISTYILSELDKEVTLLVDNWSATYPYSQTVVSSGLSISDDYVITSTLDGTESQDFADTYNENFRYITGGRSSNDAFTVIASTKPIVDLVVGLRRV